MPQLRELDLTGNGLAHLPTFLEFRKFPTLERLSLERNKLRGDAADGGGAVSPEQSELLARRASGLDLDTINRQSSMLIVL